jgi:hypothetical protein
VLASTRRGISYPNPDRSDRDDIAAHIGNVIAALDVDVVYNQGTDAARLAAAHQSGGGRFWWTTDTLTMWYDDGATWQNLAGLLVYNTQTASYTLVLSDANKVVEMNVASANNITLSLDATTNFPIGTSITIVQLGAGQTTIVATGGVTVRSYNNNLKLAGQYAVATLFKRAANDWYAAGNITP